jgi:ubiquinone/menaquinone biosynthesis C-methylase UbiE
VSKPVTDTNELAAASAFDKQAAVFDQTYSRDKIIQYKRARVRDHVESFLPVFADILELNAGTGEDAIHFAKRGHRVHATDISPAMQEELVKKVKQAGMNDRISHELCSFTQLENLQKQGPYDLVFSNFAGLNCTDKLSTVLSAFPHLVKENGFVTLVILPKFCLWEFLVMFKGKFRTAFRRFAGKKGARAHIEGEYFRCWYYNPSFILRSLKETFELVKLEGLCTWVPPSYLEGFADKRPQLFEYLRKKEERLKSRWPWRSIGDYYIITLRKK